LKDSQNKNVQQIDITLRIDVPSVIRYLKFHGDSTRLNDIVQELVEEVQAIARLKAVYTTSRVRCIDRDFVEIDGIKFTSRVLNKKLADLETVYPFIATIGKELDEFRVSPGDMWRGFCLDAIKTVALFSSAEFLTNHIKEKYKLPGVALLNPGEIEDFPLAQQIPLFKLFGGEEKKIGVSVSKGGAMRPIKSRSGILFVDETGFVSCLLCTQQKCTGRRAAYSPEMVETYLS